MRKKLLAAALSLVLLIAATTAMPMQAKAASTSSTGTASIGFTPGILLLVSVPSFEFGLANSVPDTATTYTANAVLGEILVLDERGTGAGWRVSAQMGPFGNLLYLGSDPIMPTAELQLPAPTVLAALGNIATAPSTAQAANLSPDEASGHSVLTAAAGQGNGGWRGTYAAANVKLLINPDNVTTGENTATITWTLYDAPA